MTTGEKIKALRVSKGMTQAELAEKLGVKVPAIHKYEAGIVVNLKRSTIEKLSIIFDVDPLYLLGLEDQQPDSSEKLTWNGELSDIKRVFIERLDQMTDEEVKKVIELLDVLDPLFKDEQ